VSETATFAHQALSVRTSRNFAPKPITSVSSVTLPLLPPPLLPLLLASSRNPSVSHSAAIAVKGNSVYPVRDSVPIPTSLTCVLTKSSKLIVLIPRPSRFLVSNVHWRPILLLYTNKTPLFHSSSREFVIYFYHGHSVLTNSVYINDCVLWYTLYMIVTGPSHLLLRSIRRLE
jgi:hypothetical protein